MVIIYNVFYIFICIRQTFDNQQHNVYFNFDVCLLIFFLYEFELIYAIVTQNILRALNFSENPILRN